MALVGGSRRFPTHTKLGRIMAERGIRSNQVTVNTEIYTRSMTEYLAGRKKPSPRNMARLSAYLKVSVQDLTEAHYPWLQEDQDKLDASNRAQEAMA